jgi:hypothetical protein
MATRQWHYVQEGRQAGPVGEDVIKGMAASGALRPADLVWTDGFAEWLPAGKVPEIYPRAAAGPPADDASASPYAAPKVNVSSATYGGDGDLITAGIKRALADTRPWVFFISIVSYVFCGLMALVSLFTLFFEPSTGIFLILSAVLYFFCGYHLYRYANGIRTYLRTNQSMHLTSALTAQKSFWKLIGIVSAVGLVIYVLVIIVVIATGAALGPRAFM